MADAIGFRLFIEIGIEETTVDDEDNDAVDIWKKKTLKKDNEEEITQNSKHK